MLALRPMARRRRRRSPARRSAPRRDSKAQRQLSASRSRSAREREKRKDLTVAAFTIFGADIGGRMLGTKMWQMQSEGQAATRVIFGKEVDVFVGGGYGAAIAGAMRLTKNKNMDTALLVGGALTIAVRRAFVSFRDASGGAALTI